jgi:hypothetical protein
MSQTFEDYCRKLVDPTAQEADADARFDHLHAFNFGRFVGRIENACDHFWLRVRWLLLGAAVGVTLGAAWIQIFLSQRILQFTK